MRGTNIPVFWLGFIEANRLPNFSISGCPFDWTRFASPPHSCGTAQDFHLFPAKKFLLWYICLYKIKKIEVKNCQIFNFSYFCKLHKKSKML